jgi:transcriptional regulator with XRE-family HTH domain
MTQHTGGDFQMTSEQFKAWRVHMDYSQREASEALGISQSSIELYERGAPRGDSKAGRARLRRDRVGCKAL